MIYGFIWITIFIYQGYHFHLLGVSISFIRPAVLIYQGFEEVNKYIYLRFSVYLLNLLGLYKSEELILVVIYERCIANFVVHGNKSVYE